ncbi:MAG TPA: 4-alpha-glucanotransferase [Thermoanaerobaculia bacterium]|nr:4-alpha-glucanotransferase [Thermoanaerobaculia bacterium]
MRELARLYSIQISYEDAGGETRKASRDSLEAALRARIPEGVDLKEAPALRRRTLEERLLEPVTVVWGGRRPTIETRLQGVVEWQITLEDGSVREGRGEVVDGSLVLPDRLPHGYHTLKAGQAETFVIAAPMEAPAPNARSWGVFLPLYAVRSRRNWGAGDLGDLEAVRKWVEELGGGVVATLPLLASFEDEPSPYSPVSRLFWNELYLDLERLPEWSNELRDPRNVAPLQNSDQVDYEAVGAARRRALEVMARRFRPDDDFHGFASQGAYGYAHFRAAKEERESAGYHLYVQYRMARQMRFLADEARRAGVGLYLDFPLGVNPGGYDAWKYGRSFAKGVSVGAPPDAFFTKGQNWGFPPFDPDAIREQRYDYFRASIRHHVSHAGILRLDHVMGLHRLFWIPVGGEAADGVYVRYPEEEMYAIVVLEARRAGCAVVGEDLGTVPKYVPRMMERHALRRMYVIQYEIRPEGDEPAGNPTAASVASVNTHDMPTFAGFWSGADVDDRLEQELLDREGAERERENRERMRQALTSFLAARGLLENDSRDTKAVLEALLRFLSASPAEIVLVNLEDLWLESEPQNVPGVPERSWKQKFARTLEEMRGDPELTRILRTVQEARKEVHGNET